MLRAGIAGAVVIDVTQIPELPGQDWLTASRTPHLARGDNWLQLLSQRLVMIAIATLGRAEVAAFS